MESLEKRNKEYAKIVKKMLIDAENYQRKFHVNQLDRRVKNFSKEKLAKGIAKVGGFYDPNSSVENIRDRAKWIHGESPLSPWQSDYKEHFKIAILRSVARLLCFLNPTKQGVFDAIKLCNLYDVHFIPERIYFLMGYRERRKIFYIKFEDLFMLVPIPSAIMRYCSIGYIDEVSIEWYTRLTSVLENILFRIENKYGDIIVDYCFENSLDVFIKYKKDQKSKDRLAIANLNKNINKLEVEKFLNIFLASYKWNKYQARNEELKFGLKEFLQVDRLEEKFNEFNNWHFLASMSIRSTLSNEIFSNANALDLEHLFGDLLGPQTFTLYPEIERPSIAPTTLMLNEKLSPNDFLIETQKIKEFHRNFLKNRDEFDYLNDYKELKNILSSDNGKQLLNKRPDLVSIFQNFDDIAIHVLNPSKTPETPDADKYKTDLKRILMLFRG